MGTGSALTELTAGLHMTHNALFFGVVGGFFSGLSWEAPSSSGGLDPYMRLLCLMESLISAHCDRREAGKASEVLSVCLGIQKLSRWVGLSVPYFIVVFLFDRLGLQFLGGK